MENFYREVEDFDNVSVKSQETNLKSYLSNGELDESTKNNCTEVRLHFQLSLFLFFFQRFHEVFYHSNLWTAVFFFFFSVKKSL